MDCFEENNYLTSIVHIIPASITGKVYMSNTSSNLQRVLLHHADMNFRLHLFLNFMFLSFNFPAFISIAAIKQTLTDWNEAN